MRFIQKNEEFTEIMKILKTTIDVANNLPSKIINAKFNKFVIFDGIFVFTERFHSLLLNLFFKKSESVAYFCMIHPDPETYFFHHFKKYPFLEITANITEQEYFEKLGEDPGGSPADAINSRYDVVVIFNKTMDSLIYCDHDLDVGFFASNIKEDAKLFADYWNLEKIFNYDEAMEEIRKLCNAEST